MSDTSSESRRRHAQVVNVDELDGPAPPDGPIQARMKQLGAAAGGMAIGCTHFEVPPNKSGFPYHFHCINEEALFILEGQATLRLGQDEGRRGVKLRAGDYVALPVGPASGHQLLNTGVGPLRYLCLSTMQPADVTLYPETEMVGVMAAPSIEASRRGGSWVQMMVKGNGKPDYKPGETDPAGR
jgi:uncharacterized cupin superfamily protein